MTLAEIKSAPVDNSEAVRAQVREIMERDELSQADVARGASIAYGTFTSWLGGTYGGNNAKYAEQVSRWITARAAERDVTAGLLREPEYVETPTSLQMWNLLAWAKSAPGITLITLGPGMGKTVTSKRYSAMTPHAYRVTMRPSTAGVHSMMKEIAQTLGVTERDTGKLARAIGDKLRRNGRHTLLIIDEAQNLRDEAVDELRHYLDEYGCGIALLGNEDVQNRWGRATPKEGYGQLHRRIGPRLRKLRPDPADIEQYLDAWGVENDELRKLLRVIGRKAGALGQISETMKMAQIIAGGFGVAIGADHIRAAWENRGGEQV